MNKKNIFNLKNWILISFILISQMIVGQQNKVCISFDDIPVVSYNITDPVLLENLFNNLTSKLTNYQIPAIGFVNELKLYENDVLVDSRIALLNDWINKGFDLGNHTFSHRDYNADNLTTFSQDIIKGGIVSGEILKTANKKLTYFRHPYLHVGNSKAKADSLTSFLTTLGYIIAPVTLDNDDYLFAAAYEKSMILNDSTLMLRIGHDYIAHTEKKLMYYEKQAQNLFGRNPNHILLLHPSFLNSFYLDSLVILFINHGYDFISIDRALEDKVYEFEVTRFGNWGISWIDRWALSMGKKGDFFKEEPTIPDYITKMSQK